MSKKEKRILVTGGEGFAGRYLIELLKKKGKKAKIFILDKKEADITKFDEVNKFIQKIKPDQIYHLAGFAKTIGKKDLIFKVNVDGTKNILKAAFLLKKKVRILLASSGAVYGECQKPKKETDRLNPKGAYAQSKAEMEKEAQKLKKRSKNLEIIISRAYNHLGPRQKLGFVVPDFASQIAQIEKGKLPPVIKVGNLKAKRDFLDVRDVVLAYEKIMNEGKTKVYNISTSNPISIEEILKILLSFSKTKIKVKIDPKKVRPLEIKVLSGSFSKIKKELKWQPKIPLKKTLKETLDFWRKNVEQSENCFCHHFTT